MFFELNFELIRVSFLSSHLSTFWRFMRFKYKRVSDCSFWNVRPVTVGQEAILNKKTEDVILRLGLWTRYVPYIPRTLSRCFQDCLWRTKLHFILVDSDCWVLWTAYICNWALLEVVCSVLWICSEKASDTIFHFLLIGIFVMSNGTVISVQRTCLGDMIPFWRIPLVKYLQFPNLADTS